MSTNTDLDRQFATWLADGPTELTDRVLEAALAEVHVTRQRRRWSASRRTMTMKPSVLLAAAIAFVAIVVVAGLSFLSPRFGPGGPLSPSPLPTATAKPSLTSTPSPTAIDTSSWTVYASGRNWLAIEHPADWTERPAVTDWALDDTTVDSTGVDNLIGPGGQIRVSAFSLAVDPGASLDAWIQAYCAKNTEPCTGIADRAVPVFAGADARHPGLLVPFTNDLAAFFLDTDRIYVVHSWRPEREFDSRRLVEAMIGTLCFDCASPAGATPRPS